MNRNGKRFLALMLSLTLCAAQLPAAAADGAETAAGGAVATERQAVSGGKWEKNKSGSYTYLLNGEYLTGMQEIDGVTYYFDPYDYSMLAGDTLYLGAGEGTICANDDGSLIENGWAYATTIGPPTGSGIFYMENFYSARGLRTIDGKQYFFQEKYGYALVNTKVEMDGVSYRANSEGVLTRLESGDGWHVVDGVTYYYQNGEPITGKLLEIEGELYYFDWDGKMANSGQFSTYGPMTVSGGYYYAQPDGRLLRSAWHSENGDTYYYGGDGKMLTGLQRLGGGIYYFSDKGVLFTNGFIALEGTTYLADGTGALSELTEGWNRVGDQQLYLIGGEPVRGEPYQIDGVLYAFDGNGYLHQGGMVSLYSNYYLTDEDGVIQKNTWYTDGEGQTFYFGPEGPALYGLQSIDGKRYVFAQEGLPVLLKDQTVEIGGKTYLLGADGAVLEDGWVTDGEARRYLRDSVYLTGLQEIDGTTYLFDGDGRLSGAGMALVDGDYYLTDAEGAVQTDLWYSENDQRFYFGPDGAALRGLQNIDGKRYVFAEEGRPALLKNQTVTVDGRDYILDENGVASPVPIAPAITRQPRSVSLKEGAAATFTVEATGDELGYQWHVRASGSEDWRELPGENGPSLSVPASAEVNGISYRCAVFNTAGAVESDPAVLTVLQEAPPAGWVTVDGKRYYYDESGLMLTGQWLREGVNSYYFGDDGALVTDSWLTDGGKSCYVNAQGIKVLNGWVTDGDRRYYMGADGVPVTGQRTIRGQEYYFGDDGALVTSGWVQIGGKWYHLSSSGTVQKSRWLQLDGCWYFLNAEGDRRESDWLQDGGKWYYFDADGVMVADTWREIDGESYYFNASGAMQTGKWVQSGSDWYYLNASGKAATGWLKLSGKWYWFATDGRMATGWAQIDGKRYFFSDSGAMQAGKWLQTDSGWYYLNASGAAVDGWQKLGGKWYWFDASGVMATGWQYIDGETYYFNTSGAMQANKWLQQGEDWHYLKSNGAMAAKEWRKVSGKWYWFDADGVMLASTSREIGGKVYSFNASGVCTNP